MVHVEKKKDSLQGEDMVLDSSTRAILVNLLSSLPCVYNL